MKIFGQNIYLIMEIRAILKTHHTYLLYSLICNIPIFQCKTCICPWATVPDLNGVVNSDIMSMLFKRSR